MSEDQSEAAAIVSELLDPGLSPQAFRPDRTTAAPATAWLGGGDALQQFGLRPGTPVHPHDLTHVLVGRHTDSGVRVLPDPALYNLVYLAPRSLSIAWTQLDTGAQSDIEEAIRDSARSMLAHLARSAALVDGVRPARSFVAALVSHAVGTRSDAAGPIPPLLHVHCCLFAVQDEDGTLAQPDEPTLADEDVQRECDAAAEAHLADRLVTLGYRVRNTAGAGTGHSFELDGVPRALLDDEEFWRNAGCAIAGG
ncbi:relaxase domain-containing protein [Micromonospora matsumotoense]|uniref:relaxase domain-containing protein n=1 Tax=Micromonospora matsumotoense TaxID=121616 RepID=UPI003D93BD39